MLQRAVSFVVVSLAFAGLAASATAGPDLKLVSMPVLGPPPDAGATHASVSATGRFVAFASAATNYGTPANGEVQILVRDRKFDDVEVVSVSSGGALANGWCGEPQISPDARYVLFVSAASNLVPFDTNGLQDVFRHDRLTHQTVRVSVGLFGQSGTADACDAHMSANGRYVVFTTASANLVIQPVNGQRQVYRRDLLLASTRLVSMCDDVIADDHCRSPAVTDDGRYVVFESRAHGLAPGVFGAMRKIFLADLLLDQTTVVSVAADGALANGDSFHPTINPNGRFIAFTSEATNLVKGDKNGAIDLFRLDRKKLKLRRFVAEEAPGIDGHCFRPSMSRNGHVLACEVDEAFGAPGVRQIYRFEFKVPVGVRISDSQNGHAANATCERPSVAANGRFVGFHSAAPNLTKGAVDVGVFLVKD